MRQPGWKFWLVIALILGAMAFASLTSNDEQDLVLIREVSARVAERSKAMNQRTSAVYGDLQDGEARQHYEQALELLVPFESELGLTLTSEWRVSVQAAIAEVRAGAHCRAVSGTAPSVNGDLWSRAIGLRCEELLEYGKDVEAVEVWLDGMVMVVDADAAHDSVGPFTRQWTDERISLLSAPARQRLSQGLLWLGDKLAQPINWERFLEPMARRACSGPLFAADGWLDQLMAWDSGFSPERKAVKTFAGAFRSLSMLAPVAEKWSDRALQFDSFEDAVGAASDKSGWTRIMRYREVWQRTCLAHVRLLGVALAIHDGRAPVPVPDPLGDGSITVRDRGDEWGLSAGRDVLMCNRVVKK